MTSPCDNACEIEAFDSTGYACDKCNQTITICPECNEIIIGCKCGHCEKGEPFIESD